MASEVKNQKAKAADQSTDWSNWERDANGFWFATRSNPNGEIEYNYDFHEDRTLPPGQPQNVPQIPGSDIDTENGDREREPAVQAAKFNPRYEVIAPRKQKTFWKVGRVFSILGTEPAPDGVSAAGDLSNTSSIVDIIYPGKAITEYRRFVIVQACYGYSLCWYVCPNLPTIPF